MALSKHRTSFALDEETSRLLQDLSGRWNVSQAEVVRRAVRRVAEEERARRDYLQQRLEEYHHRGKLSVEEADQYLDQLAAERAEEERGGLN